MSTRTNDRLFAALGIGFVVLSLAGTGLASYLHGGALTDGTAAWAARIAKPVPARDWVGGYLELLAVGCFLGFATWATEKLGGGLLGQLARTVAAAYAAVVVVSLGLMYGIGYAHGKGIDVPVARGFDAVNTGVYVGSWFLAAFFLLAVGALALGASRRRLGWSAVGTGAVTLAAAPSVENLGQLSVLLFFCWVAGASVALARRAPATAGAVAVAQHV